MRTVTAALVLLACWAVTSTSWSPINRTTASTEIGLSFYPRADAPQPDILKLTLNYIGERRFEGEYAHGGEASLQLRF